jgi:hypothetical protein
MGIICSNVESYLYCLIKSTFIKPLDSMKGLISKALPPELSSNIVPEASLPHPPAKQEDFSEAAMHLAHKMHGWYGMIEGANLCVTTRS